MLLFGMQARADKQADSTRVTPLLNTAKVLEFSSPDSALQLANLALSLSESIGYETGIASSNLRIGHIYLTLGNYREAAPYLYKSYTIRIRIGQQKQAVGSACLISYV